MENCLASREAFRSVRIPRIERCGAGSKQYEPLNMRVIAGRFDGIGTRLLTFMAARYFAQAGELPVRYIWPSLNDPLYQSDNLLKFSSASQVFEDLRVFKDVYASTLYDWIEPRNESMIKLHEMPWSHSHTKSLLDGRLVGHDVLLYDLPYAIDDIGPVSARDSFLRYWRSFNFATPVLEARDQVVTMRSNEPYLAVHMRRGDTAKMLAEGPIDFLVKHGFDQLFQRYLPLDQAINLIERHYEASLKIIVVSEDPTMAARMAGLLPRRNVRGTTGIFEHGGTQQALLDLLILAESDCLLSPVCSFFSECAVKVGRAANLKATFDFDYLARELFPILDAYGCKDARLRKSLFFEAAYRASGGGTGSEKLLTAADQYRCERE